MLDLNKVKKKDNNLLEGLSKIVGHIQMVRQNDEDSRKLLSCANLLEKQLFSMRKVSKSDKELWAICREAPPLLTAKYNMI